MHLVLGPNELNPVLIRKARMNKGILGVKLEFKGLG
jgi:hypothetical protein